MNDLTDAKLFVEIRNGYKKAFDFLFRKYYVLLCNFANKIVRSESIAEETVQEVFINIWEQRKKIKITTSVLSYLYSATKNQALNELSKTSIRQEYESTYENLKFNENRNSERPYTDNELRIFIAEAITKLPDKCKNIFILSRNEGLTYDEISEYLKISKKTVENQMGIAFKKLREILLPYLYRSDNPRKVLNYMFIFLI